MIELLELNRGQFLSGEEIADRLECTRGAVWKAVKSLQKEGYEITAVTNRGYCLAEDTDMLSKEGISGFISDDLDVDIEVYSEIDSTNIKAKQMAAEGAKEGTVVVASKQTKGRGRLNRSFLSPADTGVYMSIVLRPKMDTSQAIKITTAAAVAVAESLEKISDQKAQIKWVNDVYMNEKKVCGILTEASFSLEDNGFDYVVLGIGVNVYEPQNGFEKSIKDIAGAVLKERKGSARNNIVANIINAFFRYYKDIENSTYFDGYDSRLMWKGDKINLISGEKIMPATMAGIDKDCHLIVEYEDGTKDSISYGEISIRKR